MSTVDAIFCLNGIVEHYLNNGKRLYCSFIDMKKAFDSVNTCALWYKMNKMGFSGKVLNIAKCMYKSVRRRVRHCNNISDFIHMKVGLAQGEVTSTIFYSLFVEDLRLYLSTKADSGLTLEDVNIMLLLYADDMALLAETPSDLHDSLDRLKQYCDQWGMEVNCAKTKVMIFKKRCSVRRSEHWTYANTDLEIVSDFNYLGTVFNSHGFFSSNQNTLASKGLKVSTFHCNKLKGFSFTPKVCCELFDAFVSSILNYACEVWGTVESKEIERIQLRYCKQILGVKLSLSNAAVYGELNRYPLYVNR